MALTQSTISISPQLTFDATMAGAPGAPLVLLLHGFAESMRCWDAQVEMLGDAGYRAIAPRKRDPAHKKSMMCCGAAQE